MANYVLFYYQPGTPNWKQIPITGPTFSIGRAAENSLAIEDALISRQHADLHVDERGVWIVDKHSSNGVVMGGARIPAGEWRLVPLGENFAIGTTTLRVEALPITSPARQAASPAPVRTPQAAPAKASRASQPRKSRMRLPLLGLAIVTACLCLAIVGAGAVYFVPKYLSQGSQPPAAQQESAPEQAAPDQPIPDAPDQETELGSGPPQVIDSLPAAAGAGAVQDDQGASLTVPAGSLEAGGQAYLERASLTPGMQAKIEQAYQVESLAYAVRLKDGDDGSGRVDLSLPAPSPDSRLAVLVDDRYLGVLEAPAQDGYFHVAPGLVQPVGSQGYPEPEAGAEAVPNRYLVVTPKNGSSQIPQAGSLLVSRSLEVNLEGGKSCISEFWTVNHCWRNDASSVYVFWEDDVPASLKDQEFLRIEDTIQSISEIMSRYQAAGFTAAAISPSNPAYLIVEAGASEPYYSFKTGNVYLPWDIIGGIAEAGNRCNVAHEFFHWIEDENYVMGVAALSNAKSWWQEASAENGAFLLFPECIEQNLTKYGIVTTSGDVLGFQAAPFLWDGGEQARYIHALQFYLSLCEGGANCALSQQAWAGAINSGSYPMEGAAADAYMRNAKDMGRFLLGASPLESRGDAVIPPSAASGSHYGDYLILKTGGKSIWDYGMTMNQFQANGENEVAVSARIEQGGVYPLWVGNGSGTPMGGVGGHTGLPAMLEIQPGPAFWLRQEGSEPVFYPGNSGLLLGPISDKLGIGSLRLAAVAPEAAGTFQAKLSLADFSGDWAAEGSNGNVTPLNCPGYSPSEEGELGTGPDQLLQMFSGYGEYVQEAPGSVNANLVWQGSLPQGMLGSSEVTVEAEQILLHYRIEIPQGTESSGVNWLPGVKTAGGNPPVSRDIPSRSASMAALPVLPLLACAGWAARRRRKLVGLAPMLLLVCAGILLSGCVGIDVYGSLDATYTFKHVDYVGPQPGALSEGGDTGATGQAIWKLGDGQVQYDVDLTLVITGEDEEGNPTENYSPCQLTASGGATATVLPEGSVPAPDLNQ